jgi:hypothetical protein
MIASIHHYSCHGTGSDKTEETDAGNFGQNLASRPIGHICYAGQPPVQSSIGSGCMLQASFFLRQEHPRVIPQMDCSGFKIVEPVKEGAVPENLSSKRCANGHNE